MSDYMFMLENHLSSDQNRVVTAVQAKAAEESVNLFLTGGAMRDMLGGFRVRDLDFVVEGNALKVAKAVADASGATTVAVDENRRAAELIFPGGVSAQVAMARHERYTKTGAKPQVTPATIQEDLRGRDFTINAIALSLARASRGLLLDPMNGLADLQNRELRTVRPTSFYDDPARLLRFVRFRTRLGFTAEPRTQSQYENARAQNLEQYIQPRSLAEELHEISGEPNPEEMIRVLDREHLLVLFSPSLEGAKLNLAGLAKLEKIHRLLPPSTEVRFDNFAPFLYVLTEKLSIKERQTLASQTGMAAADVEKWQKLPVRAKRLETTMKAQGLRRPSAVYAAASKASGDEVLLLLYHSNLKPVQDRLKNYLQKYLPSALEVTDAEVEAASGVPPGSAKFQKAKDELISKKLNSRPKPIPVPEVVVEPPPLPGPGMRQGRRGRPPANRGPVVAPAGGKP